VNVIVVADSISPLGHRLTTMECTFHRFILPEFNTYRMWSRSAASSRAIPAKRRIEEVRENPALPVKFGRNQAGMVSGEALEGQELYEAMETWFEASRAAADYAEGLNHLGVAKEITNRVLEPFLWHTSVVSSTDYTNCFNQRIPVDAGAQSEFAFLASEMKMALESSVPREIGFGEWHLPYIQDNERYMDIELLRKISVARVARTSYLKQTSSRVEDDINLYDRLFNATPPHWAPFEMVATPALEDNEIVSGNFTGWHQLRHLLPTDYKIHFVESSTLNVKELKRY
jgi:hypothetical protein